MPHDTCMAKADSVEDVLQERMGGGASGCGNPAKRPWYCGIVVLWFCGFVVLCAAFILQ